MLIFRSEEHVDRWCGVRGMSRGALLTPAQTWALAYDWFKDKLAPEWRRHTPEEAEALLLRIGLTGDFWRLR
jgi:hypothetical protein